MLVKQQIRVRYVQASSVGLLGRNRNILAGSEPVAISDNGVSFVREETRIVVLNIAGLISLVGFTGLVYLRTQEPLILLIGGLVAVVSVLGSTMYKG